MELHRGDVDGGRDLEKGWEREVGEKGGNVVGLMHENGVRGTGEACKYIRAKVLKRD